MSFHTSEQVCANRVAGEPEKNQMHMHEVVHNPNVKQAVVELYNMASFCSLSLVSPPAPVHVAGHAGAAVIAGGAIKNHVGTRCHCNPVPAQK